MNYAHYLNCECLFLGLYAGMAIGAVATVGIAGCIREIRYWREAYDARRSRNCFAAQEFPPR